jgi:FkbM family methyltransferase
MGIISYAQNFEDVMLWRALGEAGNGFWIDVGAYDATAHSVTRAFYDRGWHGLNLEPTPERFESICAARPRDLTLPLAIGASPGQMVFYDCEDAGLSSLDPAAAARNRAAGRRVSERMVEVTTLAALCAAHAPTEIHFLKIDVEGAEAEVLAGADFGRYRPWIVVVEAVTPLTHTSSSETWEAALLQARYRTAWFDGLNRFYVADEHWDRLGRHFTVPPNVFDAFTLYEASNAAKNAALAAARAEIAMLRASLVGPQPLPGPILRLARAARAFFSAEMRQELTILRHEVARLGLEVEGLTASLRGGPPQRFPPAQLRP